MSSCLGGFGGGSASLSAAVCAFELLRFRVKLSFRRIELPIEWVLGSTELPVSMCEASSFDVFLGLCNRGPVSFAGFASAPMSKVFDFSSLAQRNSPLDLGRDDETKGDIAVRLAVSAYESEGFGTVVLELLGVR